jgi:hypothetical protein
MKRVAWVLSAWGILGCSGDVDLGEADPPGPQEAFGSQLRSFAPMPWGMCGLLEDGRAYCWGREGSPVADRVANLDGVALGSATAGQQVCSVRAGGRLACAPDVETPLQEQLGFEDSVDVSVGLEELSTLGRDGTIRHRYAQDCFDEGDPRPIELPSPAVEVRCADRGCCAAVEDGRLFCFAGNPRGTCDVSFEQVPGIDDAVGVSMTMEGACVLHASGEVSCSSGRLDPDTFLPDLATFAPVGVSNIVQLRSSRVATCGLTRSGALLCWGTSQCGALGIAENCGSTNVAAPIVVQQDIATRLFGLGDGYACSLDAAGDVWCWGFSAWTGSAQGSPIPRRIQF